MPNCHHCGTEIDDDTARFGQCRTCKTAGNFCPACGWWELGPEFNFETLAWSRIHKKFRQHVFREVISCPTHENVMFKIKPVISQCELMQTQWEYPALFSGEDYNYKLWQGELKTWGEAAVKLIATYDGIFNVDLCPLPELDARIYRMLLTFLSAYQLCINTQQARLIRNLKVLPVNLHDAALVAAHHYRCHKGFEMEEKFLEIDCLTLKHLDTIEQYFKGNMELQVAHWLILADAKDPEIAVEIAENATMIYTVFITLVEPYDKQGIPNKATFDASSNGSSGIFKDSDIKRHFYQGDLSMIKTTVENKLKELEDSFLRPVDLSFKFNSPLSQERIRSEKRLTEAQKIYLLSFQDLDASDCRSACKPVIWQRVRKNLAHFLGNIKNNETLLLKLESYNISLPIVTLPLDKTDVIDGVIHHFIDKGRRGLFPLQTCTNDATFIKDQPYQGILALHETAVELEEVLAPCKMTMLYKEKIIGLKYNRGDIEKASDNRTKSPFQYLSWRVQKDRLAHRFFKLAYSEYDVTAAISQTVPVPEPDLTYGSQLIVWNQDLLHCCTFKVGDSGRPTRSFLLLLDQLLSLAIDKNEVDAKLALFNLILFLYQIGDMEEQYRSMLNSDNQFKFLNLRPKRGFDIEAHLYGRITLKDVRLVLYPCDDLLTANTLLTQQELNFGKGKVMLYNQTAFTQRTNNLDTGDEAFKWMELIAHL